jgi:type II secretory ATPase GspE/PulE/Tfp pilus assembly ATPase PilB-like protein
MGVEPYVTAATVTAILAQRLVRRRCVHCRERYEVLPDEARELELGGVDRSFLFRARAATTATAVTAARSGSTN